MAIIEEFEVSASELKALDEELEAGMCLCGIASGAGA